MLFVDGGNDAVNIGTTDSTFGLNVGGSGSDIRGKFQGSNQYRLSLRNGTSDQVYLGSGGANNFRISNNSGSTLFELTSASNILLPTSSAGIYLGVTSETASNLLDDYEEGTWTPVYGGGTTAGTASVGSTEGLYTKIGDSVTIWLRLTNLTLSNGAGAFKITGLPFTSSHGTGAYASAAIAMTHAINFDTARNQSLYLIGTALYGLESINGTTWTDWNVTNGSGIYMNYTITYRTT